MTSKYVAQLSAIVAQAVADAVEEQKKENARLQGIIVQMGKEKQVAAMDLAQLHRTHEEEKRKIQERASDAVVVATLKTVKAKSKRRYSYIFPVSKTSKPNDILRKDEESGTLTVILDNITCSDPDARAIRDALNNAYNTGFLNALGQDHESEGDGFEYEDEDGEW